MTLSSIIGCGQFLEPEAANILDTFAVAGNRKTDSGRCEDITIEFSEREERL
jgi:hypothetical protein